MALFRSKSPNQTFPGDVSAQIILNQQPAKIADPRRPIRAGYTFINIG